MGGKSQRTVRFYLSPSRVEEMHLRDKNVVVIDVLRASTTIAAALNQGAKEIIPVASVEGAVKISGSLFGDVTLRGGERNGKVIDGFNLGNSPREYTSEAVRGKSIIYTTTNGSGALVKSRYARHLVVGGFVNFSQVATFLKELKDDFVILCAGRENGFSLEDTVCGGMLLARVQKTVRGLQMDDAGRMAMVLAAAFEKNIAGMLRETDHGRFLSGIGFEDDLDVCADLDSIPVLPVMTGNAIKLMKVEEEADRKADGKT